MSGPSPDEVAATLAALRKLRTGATGDPHASWDELPEEWADLAEPAQKLDTKMSGWLRDAREAGQ